MITDALLNLLSWIVNGVLDAIPEVGVPGWLLSLSGMLGSLFDMGASLGAWIPWTLVGAVAGTVVATWAIAFGVKLTRIVASFLTLGGGSAA